MTIVQALKRFSCDDIAISPSDDPTRRELNILLFEFFFLICAKLKRFDKNGCTSRTVCIHKYPADNHRSEFKPAELHGPAGRTLLDSDEYTKLPSSAHSTPPGNGLQLEDSCTLTRPLIQIISDSTKFRVATD